MPEPFDEELLRLEGRPTTETCWRAKMWRRSYCIALNAIKSLEGRLLAARKTGWDAPMIFFYPDPKP
jgi:hypothetical protein